MKMLSVLNKHCFFAIVFCLFSGIAAAQHGLPDSIALRETVIQATRVRAGAPIAHNNISGKNLAAQYQAQDVPFLLGGLPSVVETSDGGTGTGYTAMRIRGSDATRINVTINGIPLNDAESQGVFWVDLPDLATSATEIQVQRGVGSSTNGAGAFGATVNLDLSKINAEPSATLSGSIGSFGTHRHSVQLNSGLLGGHFAFTGRLSGIRSDGYVQRAASNLNSAHFSAAYVDDRQSLLFHVLSGKEITYQAWYGIPVSYANDDILRTYNPAGTERPGSPYANQVDNYTQRHYLLRL